MAKQPANNAETLAKTQQGHAKNARSLVYEHLRNQIIGLYYRPGSAISENEIAKQLDVSRTPGREALVLLAEEDFVQIVPKVGTFVTDIDMTRVKEAQFLREAVEVTSLRQLKYPLDKKLIELISGNLDRQAALEVGDYYEFFYLDEEFHRLLMALGSHHQSWDYVVQAKSHLDRARIVGLREIPDNARFSRQHRRIFNAVLDEDIETAISEMENHLRIVFDDIRILDQVPAHPFAQYLGR
ncbi:MAG: GntR family transcriptional regulator [Arcanobacterium sp.]|nr:GntR family transcriptional regulator [Arcanobacterium sp.]